MNEQLFYVLSRQRYHEDVKRGEANYTWQAVSVTPSNGPRARLAVVLVSLATRLQPSLDITIQQPSQPAAA